MSLEELATLLVYSPSGNCFQDYVGNGREEAIEGCINWLDSEHGRRCVMRQIDYALQIIQLYSYKLPTVKIGNWIMDFRKKYTMG